MSFNFLANSGFTGALTKGGLAIGGTPAQLALATPDGTSGITYAIDGIAYYLADTASTAMTAMSVQADLTSCLYLVMLNSGGTLTTKKGIEKVTLDLGEVGGTLQWPFPDVDTCPIGGFKVALTGTTYTGGTTSLATGNLADTYYDFAGGIPLAPQVS